MRTHTFAPAGTNLSPHLGRNEKGRDLVVGDVHGHFATLRRALDELEVGEHDRVFSLGDLVDRGPDSTAAKDWIAGSDPSQRFHLVIRGNHEQMMLEALAEGPPPRRRIWDENAWTLWPNLTASPVRRAPRPWGETRRAAANFDDVQFYQCDKYSLSLTC